MTTTTPTTRPIVRIIHFRRLRPLPSVKFVWWYLTGELDLTQPQVIKIAPTARFLGLKVRTMQRAMKLLVQHRYLDTVVAPTGGTPGEYIAGPRAYRLPPASVPLPRRRKARRGPPSPHAQLSLSI